MASWLFDFSSPDDIDSWTGDQAVVQDNFFGNPVPCVSMIGSESGSPGRHRLQTVLLEAGPNLEAVNASADYSAYVFEEDFTANWGIWMGVDFYDAGQNLLAEDEVSFQAVQSPADQSWYNIQASSMSPPSASRFFSVWFDFVWDNHSSAYSWSLDNIHIEAIIGEEPIAPLSQILHTGFRFPHPKWSRTSTATNLLFLETQLEKYLHSHEGEEEPEVVPL